MTYRMLAMVVAAGFIGISCVNVPAYQRGPLMRRTMQPKGALDAAADVHVAELRESALGATEAGGASCGCR